MATFPTPSQVFDQYKTILKSLRPDLNVNDPNSDVVIRGRVLAGILSGLYADQKKVDDDTYIQDAREEALVRHGDDEDIARQPPTSSTSQDVLFTGTPGTVLNAGLSLRYNPTGVLYTLQAQVTLDAFGNGHGQVQANVTGQVGNVAANDTLTLVSPPPGANPTATLILPLADGADQEGLDSYRSRLLQRLQRPPSGGNAFDYPTYAFKADPSVRSAFIRRFGRGLGTVDVYVTTGTTDIDTAILQGLTILRIPNPATIAIIQAYYDQNVPLTDCPKVFPPTEVNQNVTVKVDLAGGLTLSSIPSNPTYNPLNLTIQQLVIREVSRVLYKFPVGGRILPGLPGGYVVASDIEHQLDVMLSALPDNSGLAIGNIPVLTDRQVQPLDSPNVNRALLANQLAKPGTVTVTVGV
jgi:uncharacterized phage protein gp47/JayE